MNTPRSVAAPSRRCELRWRTVRFGWRGVTVWPGIRHAFNWCWRPTRVLVRHPTPASASAPRPPSAGIWASCRAHCWTASICGSSCTARRPKRSRPRQASRRRVVRDRVKSAREAAAQRWQKHGIRTNAEVSGVLLRRRFRLESDGDGTVEDGARPRRAQHPWRRQDTAGRLDAFGLGRPNVAGRRGSHHSTELPAMRAVCNDRRHASRIGVPVAGGRAALSRAGDVGESRRARRGRRARQVRRGCRATLRGGPRLVAG